MEPKSNATRPTRSPRMPKKNPARQHAEHLQIQQQDAVTHQQFPGKAHLLQAGDAQDGEQNQIINIHEVTERADNHGGFEDLAQDGLVGFMLRQAD